MKALHYCLLFLHLGTCTYTKYVASGISGRCQTVQQKPGRCVELENCPSLFSISQNKSVCDNNAILLLLSECRKGESQVCCDLEEINESPAIRPRSTGRKRSAQKSDCSTPDGSPGLCIATADCPSLARLLSVYPFPEENQKQLLKAGCGFDGIAAKVCCALTEINFETEGVCDGSIESGSATSALLPNKQECGAVIQSRLKGGTYAEIAEFPWIARLEYHTPTGSKFVCGGSLINDRYVLTAAHCIKGKDLPMNWKLISVRLGEYNTQTEEDCTEFHGHNFCASPTVNVGIEEEIVHENYMPYSTSQHHDIALLRLVQKVEYTDYIKPICIPTTDLLDTRYTGVNMTVAGWGQTDNNTASNILLKLQIPVKSDGDCVDVYGGKVDWCAGQMCAGGEKDRDSCKGDSGGPLMVQHVTTDLNYYVAGIVSFGPDPCGLERWPGVYTKVSKYVPWIIKQLKP